VRRAVKAAGLEEHQYIAVRHSEQEHEHLHVAVSKIHPETLKIHQPYKAIHTYQALASVLERELGTSRGSIVHNLAGGIRLRESAGSIELLGETSDDGLEQLVTVAKQRFGTKQVTLLGTRGAQQRLAQLGEERGLEIAEERQR
jgi:hypothetical protein